MLWISGMLPVHRHMYSVWISKKNSTSTSSSTTAMVLRYPDEPPPELQMSLKDFVDLCLLILKHDDDIDMFCRAILAGHVAEDPVLLMKAVCS